ncbi:MULTISPECIES: hypothetical protein [Thalassolituus]|jgi:hypothetical protein|uniref:hypothetical protein n=1 Tax=Thalassolituus TaxID=187492 RepID=UPI0024098B67|nr:hypothetical protein [Thalassolituus oleivorans]MDF1641527.1 hypothetical protein [Thalassolituus oleivorans]
MALFWQVTRSYITPVVAAFLGGYLFTWGLVSLLISGMVYLGGDFHNAETIGFLLAFPIFLFMFFWIFIGQRRWLPYGTAFIGGVSMTAAAYGLQTQLIQ